MWFEEYAFQYLSVVYAFVLVQAYEAPWKY